LLRLAFSRHSSGAWLFLVNITLGEFILRGRLERGMSPDSCRACPQPRSFFPDGTSGGPLPYRGRRVPANLQF